MPSNRSMPPGPVIPELPYADVPVAARWLCSAFGFRERLRIGSHRIQLHVGAGAIVVVEGRATQDACRWPPWTRTTPRLSVLGLAPWANRPHIRLESDSIRPWTWAGIAGPSRSQ